MGVVDNKIKEIQDVISKSKMMTFEKLVTWQELSDWKIGEQRNISGTLNTKLVEEDNLIIVKTIVPEIFNEHWHDFVEHIFLVKGRLRDCKKEHKTGDWICYELLEPHFVENLDKEPSELIVIFTR